MKRSSRRRLRRLFQTPLDKSAAVFTILGTLGVILVTAVQPSSGWLWLALALVLIGLAWLVVGLYRTASTPEESYFEEVFFGDPSDPVVISALHSLLNGEKARPEFVHAAPKNKEVDLVCRGLHESGFATIYGGSGEGKSMTAYHSAYRLCSEEGYSPYTLRVDLLTNRFSDFRDELLAQFGQPTSETKTDHRGQRA